MCGIESLMTSKMGETSLMRHVFYLLAEPIQPLAPESSFEMQTQLLLWEENG
jgi:hypothetical protein